MESRKLRCYSPNCKEKEVSSASFYRHKRRREAKEDVTVYQEDEISIVHELVEGPVVEGSEVVLNEIIEPEAEADVVSEEGVEFIEGRIPLPAQKTFTLESAMKTQMVTLQADLDSGN